MRTQLLMNVSGLVVCLAATIASAEPLRLENDKLALRFDAASGTLTAVQNKLTGEITQEHPAPGRTQTARDGATIRWEVPAQTAVVLRIQKAEKKG